MWAEHEFSNGYDSAFVLYFKRITLLSDEPLQKFHYCFGDDLNVEWPTGSGAMMNPREVSQELSRRLSPFFLRDGDGKRAVFGGNEKFQTYKYFRDHILFYEYFHGENGSGLGAGHQTGWTAIVAKLLQQNGDIKKSDPKAQFKAVPAVRGITSFN